MSAMEITEELRRAVLEEIKRVVRNAKFFVRATRFDGERVCLWVLPEGGVVKVVETADPPEGRRLRVYLWKEEEFEQFSYKAKLNKRRWFKDWKIQSVDVIEKNWTKEERKMVEEWEKKEKAWVSFFFSFITENLTKEDFEHSQYKHILQLPEDFWQLDFKKQLKLLRSLHEKHQKEGNRKGYGLFLYLSARKSRGRV
jgi:hypothetical protein